MKFSVLLALAVGLVLTACEIDEPPRVTRRPAVRPQAAPQYPPQPQPFPQDQVPPTDMTAPPIVEQTPPPSTPTAVTSTSSSAPAKGDHPYGVPVPGKPGFVHSPFSPDKMTDVRGYAPGTEVKDPYTGKIFLVP